MQKLFLDMIEQQKKKLLAVAEEVVPYITTDDILQPNDFPALENHPYFRYEEGVLEGMQSAYAAYMAESRVSGSSVFLRSSKV